jgi:hypothetical protein
MSAPDRPSDDADKKAGFRAAQAARGALLERLMGEGAEELAARLRLCGQTLDLRCKCCGQKKTVERRCERRWCPVCARKIAAERVARYTYAVARMEWPLFLTLTVVNSLEAWEGIKRLKSCWGKMRRRKWFLGCQVAGGITAIEITNQGRGWHPHLHSVIDCRWLAVDTPRPMRGDSRERVAEKCRSAKAELDAEWARVTMQPTASTYVKRLPRLDLREVLKYSVDPGTLLGEEGRISELIDAIDKFRMVQPFGSCMGIAAEIAQLAAEDYEAAVCPKCASAAWEPVLVVTRGDAAPREMWRPQTPTPRKDAARVQAAMDAAQLKLSAWGYGPPKL